MKIELKNINKSFDKKHILKDISFSIKSGRALGFLGRNGAGKTTTIRILMDIFRGDTGEILLDGKKFNREEYKIGYLPEERGMYQKVNILDQLIYFGELRGMSRKSAKERGEKLLKKLGIAEYANKKLETLSKGNQQKVQLAEALITDPDIIILDEPFSGLDPVNAQSLKNIIKENIAKDKIVIFSSHQMSQVEEFCQDIVFIKAGRIIKNCSLEELKSEYSGNKYIINTTDNDKLKKILEKNKISYYEEKEIIIENSNLLDIEKPILKNDIVIEKIAKYQKTLEEIFVEIEGDNNE